MLDTLQRIVDRGLAKSGRMGKISVMLQDKPGALVSLLDIIAKGGANILSVGHDRVDNSTLNTARVELSIETNNKEHLQELLNLINIISKTDRRVFAELSMNGMKNTGR